MRLFVVVSGPPASGKSTLAPALAHELQLPLIAKDTIKDALMETMAVPDVAASREIGRAAVLAMLAVAAESPIGAVIESNFYRSAAVQDLRQLPGLVVKFFCRCTPDEAARRYAARGAPGTQVTSTTFGRGTSSGTNRSLSPWTGVGRC